MAFHCLMQVDDFRPIAPSRHGANGWPKLAGKQPAVCPESKDRSWPEAASAPPVGQDSVQINILAFQVEVPQPTDVL